jgi:DNA-binding NtrC family response regulator
MNSPLAGHLILIAEDEPLVAIQMIQAFEDVGAWILRARTLKEALAWVEGRKLSAAVLDHTLSDSDTSAVCKRLNERNIPFVIHSAHPQPDGANSHGVHVKKTLDMRHLLGTVERAIAERQISIQQQVSAAKCTSAASTARRTLHVSFARHQP